ncbi:uncharacterized protein LOC131629930 [Vicia villosa]|uniref:uncharacterized protein LOC131629930 n=1 Tax=Vicia villosa TaxID=3911 RepID=UPI00273CCA9B|nr:uncharacterized protein LOC131629930 [Vicia villosa]
MKVIQSLVLYALGGELSMHYVKNFMIKNWNFVQLPDMYYHEDGYFILRFKSYKERDDVLMKGPYFFINMPLLIREWRVDFNLQTDLLRTLPIWVKLPNLPLYLWGETSLNKIGSALGVPIVTDECTANRLRISYARILVEMDITKDLPIEITIRDNVGEKMQQAIDYKWRPILCGRCQKFGHHCDKPKPKVKVWQPKPKPPGDIKNQTPLAESSTSPLDEKKAQNSPIKAAETLTVEETTETWTSVNKNVVLETWYGVSDEDGDGRRVTVVECGGATVKMGMVGGCERVKRGFRRENEGEREKRMRV